MPETGHLGVSGTAERASVPETGCHAHGPRTAMLRPSSPPHRHPAPHPPGPRYGAVANDERWVCLSKKTFQDVVNSALSAMTVVDSDEDDATRAAAGLPTESAATPAAAVGESDDGCGGVGAGGGCAAVGAGGGGGGGRDVSEMNSMSCERAPAAVLVQRRTANSAQPRNSSSSSSAAEAVGSTASDYRRRADGRPMGCTSPANQTPYAQTGAADDSGMPPAEATTTTTNDTKDTTTPDTPPPGDAALTAPRTRAAGLARRKAGSGKRRAEAAGDAPGSRRDGELATPHHHRWASLDKTTLFDLVDGLVTGKEVLACMTRGERAAYDEDVKAVSVKTEPVDLLALRGPKLRQCWVALSKAIVFDMVEQAIHRDCQSRRQEADGGGGGDKMTAAILAATVTSKDRLQRFLAERTSPTPDGGDGGGGGDSNGARRETDSRPPAASSSDQRANRSKTRKRSAADGAAKEPEVPAAPAASATNKRKKRVDGGAASGRKVQQRRGDVAEENCAHAGGKPHGRRASVATAGGEDANDANGKNVLRNLLLSAGVNSAPSAPTPARCAPEAARASPPAGRAHAQTKAGDKAAGECARADRASVTVKRESSTCEHDARAPSAAPSGDHSPKLGWVAVSKDDVDVIVESVMRSMLTMRDDVIFTSCLTTEARAGGAAGGGCANHADASYAPPLRALDAAPPLDLSRVATTPTATAAAAGPSSPLSDDGSTSSSSSSSVSSSSSKKAFKWKSNLLLRLREECKALQSGGGDVTDVDARMSATRRSKRRNKTTATIGARKVAMV